MYLKIFRKKNRSWYYRREWMGLNNLVGAPYECTHRHCAYMRACQRVLLVLLFIHPFLFLHARIQRGSRGSVPSLKKYKNIGFLSNVGPDPLKNHKATKPAINVWPSWARRWWPLFNGIWIISPQEKESWTHSDITIWIGACARLFVYLCVLYTTVDVTNEALGLHLHVRLYFR